MEKQDFQKSTIYVAFAGNDSYKDALLTASLSLLKNTPDRPVHFYFLTGDFPTVRKNYIALKKETAERILSYGKKYNPHVTYTILDLTETYKTHLKHNFNKHTFYSVYAMLRLLLDEIPDMPDKILYLDGDTLTMKSLAPLYDLDMDDYEVAMVQDAVGHHYFGKKYCNSGVMLINLKKIREEKGFFKVRKFMKHHLLFMPDQTSINAVLKKKLILPRKYNEQKKTEPDTVIRHYCKVFHWLPFIHIVNVKPWDAEKFRKHFGDENKDIIDECQAIRKGQQ